MHCVPMRAMCTGRRANQRRSKSSIRHSGPGVPRTTSVTNSFLVGRDAVLLRVPPRPGLHRSTRRSASPSGRRLRGLRFARVAQGSSPALLVTVSGAAWRPRRVVRPLSPQSTLPRRVESRCGSGTRKQRLLSGAARQYPIKSKPSKGRLRRGLPFPVVPPVAPPPDRSGQPRRACPA